MPAPSCILGTEYDFFFNRLDSRTNHIGTLDGRIDSQLVKLSHGPRTEIVRSKMIASITLEFVLCLGASFYFLCV